MIPESLNPSIDQNLDESDFKLGSLLAIGSRPDTHQLTSNFSEFEKVDLMVNTLRQFGYDQRNFKIEEPATTPAEPATTPAEPSPSNV